jgi:hypothetical protein
LLQFPRHAVSEVSSDPLQHRDPFGQSNDLLGDPFVIAKRLELAGASS